MLIDYFPSKAALDPTTGSLLLGTTAQVFDQADVALENPLELENLQGDGIGTTIQSSMVGFYPDFRAPGHTQVVAVSGTHRTPLVSLYGLILSVLPDPSSAVDGQVLQTSGGAYVLSSAGAGLPDPAPLLDGTILTVSSGAWVTSTIPAGGSGREVQLQNSGTAIQWRYVGDAAWNDLVALSAITGPPSTTPGPAGAAVQMRVSGGYFQWKLTTDATWQNLLEVPTGGSGTGRIQYATSATTWPDRMAGDDPVLWIGTRFAGTVDPPTATDYDLVIKRPGD